MDRIHLERIRDVAPYFRVESEVDFTHPACPELPEDFVAPEPSIKRNGHKVDRPLRMYKLYCRTTKSQEFLGPDGS